MSTPIRVAHIIDVMDSGGIEAVVMNYYRNIDRTKVQFDFITSDISKLPQREEIEKLGGRIFLTPRYTKIFKYGKVLKKIFSENKYKIVHCHMGTLALFPLRIAKKCGVEIRIAHCHSTSNKKEWKRNLVKNILRPFSKIYANKYFACSELAGRYLFGNKEFDKGNVTIVNNAIDTEKFAYNENVRNEVRKELDVENKFVLGHIGRFVTQKNHTFLIDIFNEVKKKRNDAILILVGEGPLEKETKEKVENLNISDSVKFLGVRKDCDRLYQAMDVFVLPSLYEGLPVVGVEAQCAGIKCLFSDKTTKEIEITENALRVPLEKNFWVDKICESSLGTRNVNVKKFDIKENAKVLQKKYKMYDGE